MISKNNKSLRLFFLITAVFVVVGIFFAIQTVNFSNSYKNEIKKYTAERGYEKRILEASEWLKGDLDIEWMGVGIIDIEVEREPEQSNKIQAKEYYSSSINYAFFILSASILYFAIMMALYFKTVQRNKAISLSLIFIAAVSLYVGLFSPMIEMAAFKKDLEINLDIKKLHLTKRFPGEMYFYYQSKSVAELVKVLFDSGNFFVGISIMFFSVIIPVTKVSLTLIASFKANILNNKFTNFMINKAGKWSMADVFVVAVYLAYLSYNNLSAGVSTESNTLVGMYFFAGYCILSITSSYFIGKKKTEIV